MKADLSTLPIGVLVGLGVLLVLELALDVIALVSLARRPRARIALGSKWIWVAIIVLLNVIGPILYFAIGRKTDGPAEVPAPARESGASAESIADSLYGRRDDPDAP